MATKRKKKLFLDRFEIDKEKYSESIHVYDHETMYDQATFDWRPEGTITKIIKKPTKVLSIKVRLFLQCCGVSEIGGFFVHDKIKLPDELYKEVFRQMHILLRKNGSLCFAFFVKKTETGDKDFQDKKLMDALLEHGWVKTGEPFYNRRYGIRHLIQGLAYLFQSGKKGNQYGK